MLELTDLIRTVPAKTQVVAVTGSLVVLLLVVDLVRRGRIKEGYSIGWFGLALIMLIFSVFTSLLDRLAELAGISYAPAVMLLVLFGCLVLLALHYSVLVTRFDRQVAHLAQDNALLRNKLEKL